MQLPFFKKSSPPPKREYLFALEIDHFSLRSAVWSVFNAKPQVLSVGMTVSWDDNSADSLLAAADQSLSDSSSRLDASGKILPTRVILGIPPDWLESDQISPSRRQLLKFLSQKLSLELVGFVVTPEAAVKYIHTTDGVPPTAILLGIWPHNLEVVLSRLGRISGIHEVSRSTDLASDVVEGLSRFPATGTLPSRVLLYDSGLDLEDIRQRLLAFPWQAPQTRLSFLHFPKIEILPTDFTIRAIALAGGTEVARAIGLLPENPATAVAVPEPEPEPETQSDLGFSEAEISVETPQPPPEPIEHPIPRPKPKFLPLLIIAVLVILSVAALAAAWFLPKASVTLHLATKTLGDQVNLTVDSAVTAPDLSKSILPAQIVTTTVDGSKTAPATGSKLVGDKATGSVTIVNSTPSSKSFPAGTIVSSPSGLKFTLDDDASVASASGTADNISLGKTTVKVTASQIGSDSNLSAGTYFRIGSFASIDVVAKNDSSLSGGSSKQVKAVSKDDISHLRSDLSSSLKTDLSSKFSDKLSSGQILLSETLQSSVASEKLDHQEGDTADQTTLTQTLKIQALAIKQSDLDALITEQLRTQIPSGYEYVSSSHPAFTVQKSTSSSASLSSTVTASLLPVVDKQAIVKAVTGLPVSRAQTYLQSVTGISSAKIVSILPFLPHLPQNITLDIRSD